MDFWQASNNISSMGMLKLYKKHIVFYLTFIDPRDALAFLRLILLVEAVTRHLSVSFLGILIGYNLIDRDFQVKLAVLGGQTEWAKLLTDRYGILIFATITGFRVRVYSLKIQIIIFLKYKISAVSRLCNTENNLALI
jgi:hypothetical protein